MIVTDPTVKQFLESLKTTDHEQGSSSHTILAYRADLQKFVEHLLEHNWESPINWSAVTKHTVENFTKTLEMRGLAASTINRKIASLSSFFMWAVAHEKIETNPAKRGVIKRQSVTSRRNPALTSDEIKKLLDAPWQSNRDPNSAIAIRDELILLLGLCGLRVSDLLNIKIQDVNTESRFVRVGDPVITIPLCGALFHTISQYLGDLRSGLQRSVHDDTLILNSRGGPLTRAAVHYILKAYVQAAGLPTHISTGTLRLTYVSQNSHLSEDELHDRLGMSIVSVRLLKRRIGSVAS